MPNKYKVSITALICCACLTHLWLSAMCSRQVAPIPVEALPFSRATLSWELINWQYFCEDEVSGSVVPRLTSNRRMRSMCITNVFHALTAKGYTLKNYNPPKPNSDLPGLFYQTAEYSNSADGTRYDIQYVTSRDVQLGGQMGLMDLTRYFGNMFRPPLKVQYAKGPGNICLLESRYVGESSAAFGRIAFSRDNVAVQVEKYSENGNVLEFAQLLDAEILASKSPPPEPKQSLESIDWSWDTFRKKHIQGEVKFPVRSEWVLRDTPSTNTFYAATTNRQVKSYPPSHFLRSFTLRNYLPPQRCEVPGLTFQYLTFARKGEMERSFSIEWTTSNDPINGGRQGLVYLAKDYCESWERTLKQVTEGAGDICLIDTERGHPNPTVTLFFCRDNIAVRVHTWSYIDIEDAHLIDACLLSAPIIRKVSALLEAP